MSRNVNTALGRFARQNTSAQNGHSLPFMPEMVVEICIKHIHNDYLQHKYALRTDLYDIYKFSTNVFHTHRQ
jgi:hypothetical protein